MDIPKSHPRYHSLLMRERIVEGVKEGIVALQGLIAHGRGEAFDYLLGERTNEFAMRSTRVAVATLLLARSPVISVNGNSAVLCPEGLIELSVRLKAPLEVNLFYDRERREEKVVNYLKEVARELSLRPVILSASEAPAHIPELESSRRIVHREGIYQADVVLVPLEDGDRTEALIKMGKKVIAVDLNPLSRTARMATITIVDELTRVIKLMNEMVEEMRGRSPEELEEEVSSFSNSENLALALEAIKRRLEELGDELRARGTR